MTTPDSFRPDELRRKYLEERDKRLRSEGAEQYVDVAGQFAGFARDPHDVPISGRAPVLDQVEVVVLGGGFGGLQVAARLKQVGISDVRIVDKAADFGGTWYWNTYPGVRCDVESYCYLPLLEETGYIPTEKYAGGAEIFEYCRTLATHFGLYDGALLQTEVTDLAWDEAASRWTVSTNRGDAIKARFVCLSSGGFHRPKLPGIPGIEEFEGHAFHTSRWDYSYTHGNSSGGLTGLAGQRVAVIGTGASAIQCIPHLGEYAEHLYVFQRTPSTVDVRGNRPTDPAWAATLEPGWQQRRIENFTSILVGIPQDEDLVHDRWTEVWGSMSFWKSGSSAGDGANAVDSVQLADYRHMEEIRQRVASTVTDPAVAEALKPWYNFFCKRPLYSDDFLPTFNRPNVTLVDTAGRGVDRITKHAIEFDGESYHVDCIAFATGFKTGAAPYESGAYHVTGSNGLDLSQKWSTGVRSLHGISVHGFPNLFILGNKEQTAKTTNVAHMLGIHARHIASVIRICSDRGIAAMDVRQDAEDQWADEVAAAAMDRRKFEAECTPGYFNNEGRTDTGSTIVGAAYGGGPFKYEAILREWRATGFDTDLQFQAAEQPESSALAAKQ
jgi:cation diffusion facilitator CzcD-associated flavoprotein CzcO